jgi:hypothetical protein
MSADAAFCTHRQGSRGTSKSGQMKVFALGIRGLFDHRALCIMPRAALAIPNFATVPQPRKWEVGR